MTTTQEQAPLTAEQQAENSIRPEWDSAIQHNSASFDHLTGTVYGMQGEFGEDAVGKLVCQKYYPQILTAFEVAHGAIIASYWCSNIIACAVRTNKDELYVIKNLQEPQDLELEINILLSQCDSLYIDAYRLLKRFDRQICVEMIYNVIASALEILDASASKKSGRRGVDRYSKMVDHLKAEVARATEYYQRSAHRTAQFHYFLGMLWGVLALAPIGALIGFGLSLVEISGLVLEIFLGVLIGGGIGAVVSVMSRMTFGRLSLNYQAGTALLQLVGSFRPVIGSIFGLALYILVASGILPIAEPAAEVKQLYFYSAIAFSAGFSERWAQDMLAVARRRVSAAGDPSPPSTPPAPPSGQPPPL